MSAAGRSLQGLLGSYTKKGVCLNEPLTAHSRGTRQRLCTAIQHAYVQMQYRHHRRQPAEYARKRGLACRACPENPKGGYDPTSRV